jgi:hypothetical protein
MADVQEPQFQTLAERIASLNKQKNFQAPEPKAKRAPPPPPTTRPNGDRRSHTLPIATTTNGSTDQQSPTMPPRPSRPAAKDAAPPLPRRTTGASVNEGASSPSLPDRITVPPLPGRDSSQNTSPALPPRRPSTQSSLELDVRRKSTASEISQLSTVSSVSLNASSATSYNSDGVTRKLPPTLDQANLPPLPPTRREREAQEAAEKEAAQSKYPLVSSKSTPTVRQIEVAPRPSLPPRLPSRPARSPAPQQTEFAAPSPPPRRLPPPPSTYVKAPTANGRSPRDDGPPPLPAGSRDSRDAPPPVPLSSRPSAAQIEAASIRAAAAQRDSCLSCRDFSGPDRVAASYPRHSLPRHDATGYLARVLCEPFPSQTDKARAIFTWFHHNIAYDVVSFMGNCVRHQTGEETIASGLAVCAGYAETYKDIAVKAGLDCVVVTGHGKGAGHRDLRKGEPPPPRKPDGHAWNAVRIDGGEWKLLDACWGAGNVCLAKQVYTPAFKPNQFTSSNEIFGNRHYPENPAYFFRSDGKIPTWEEYYIGQFHGEGPLVYGNAYEEGIDETSISPLDKDVPVRSGGVVRFQFSKVCQHWKSEKNGKGKPMLMLMTINGLDGRKTERIPMETDGFWYWFDVNSRDLGTPPQSVSVVGVNDFDGRDGRGVTAKEYLSKRGRVGMSFVGIMKWDLV